MLIRKPEETALLVALLFKRANEKRARISTKTLRVLSGRKHIRGSFVEILTAHLDALGLIMIENERGSFSVFSAGLLDGAPSITVSKYLQDDLEKLETGEINFDFIWTELCSGIEFDEEEEDS